MSIDEIHPHRPGVPREQAIARVERRTKQEPRPAPRAKDKMDFGNADNEKLAMSTTYKRDDFGR